MTKPMEKMREDWRAYLSPHERAQVEDAMERIQRLTGELTAARKTRNRLMQMACGRRRQWEVGRPDRGNPTRRFG